MNNRLYVGNLAFHTTEDTLLRTFGEIGEVSEAKLIIDRETGRSRGFAFVSMSSEQDAQRAIEQMDGADLDGRALRVNIAEERRPRAGGDVGVVAAAAVSAVVAETIAAVAAVAAAAAAAVVGEARRPRPWCADSRAPCRRGPPRARGTHEPNARRPSPCARARRRRGGQGVGHWLCRGPRSRGPQRRWRFSRNNFRSAGSRRAMRCRPASRNYSDRVGCAHAARLRRGSAVLAPDSGPDAQRRHLN